VWTSSGVSAGMDMMVAFLRRVYGDARVNGVVNGAEYLANVDARWDPFSVIHEVGFVSFILSFFQFLVSFRFFSFLFVSFLFFFIISYHLFLISSFFHCLLPVSSFPRYRYYLLSLLLCPSLCLF